jgi:hypothetical protein
MRKLSLNSFLVLLCLTNLTIIAQSEFSNYADELTIEISYKAIPNSGTCTGAIEVLTLNGNAPYQYSVDAGENFQINKSFNGLCAKKYFVHVRDNDGKLGIALVNFPVNEIPEITVVDTNSLVELFNQSTNLVEKRSIQSQLAAVGVKFPVVITQKDVGSFSMPLFRIPNNTAAFADRLVNSYEKIKSVTIENDVLNIEFNDFKESYLTKLAEKFGYSGYELINE